MSKLITASVNLEKVDKAKIISGEKGKYLNLTIWVNDEKDQYGNDVSVQQTLSKEERESGAQKIYLGNGRTFDSNGGGNTAPAAASTDSGDLPF